MSQQGEGRKAIIIGATSGIGLEVARQLHADGWTVGLAGRRQERLDAIAREMGERCGTMPLDVCSENAPQRLLTLIETLEGADLILLAAGIGWKNPELDAERELATVGTNAEGFVRMAGAAYRYFRTQGHGHLAAITSIAGTKGLGAAPAYSATKRMQSTYLQCLAQLARMDGIDLRVTDIQPGFVATDLLGGGHYPLTMRADYVARRIVKALYRGRRRVVIDWRYDLLTALWREMPNWLWERLRWVK